MKRLLIRLWETAWTEFSLRTPKLRAICASYARDLTANFPLGWAKTAPAPYYLWVGQRSSEWINDVLDWAEEALGVLPALVVANVIISALKIDPKLRQRVMTLDQVALFPARVIIDVGIREIVAAGAPRAFEVQQKGKKLEDLFVFLRTGKLSKLKSLLFGSLWSRIVRLVFLAMKMAKTFAYVVLLWRYTDMLEDRAQWSLLFNARLSDQNPREKQRARIRRRVGGVKP